MATIDKLEAVDVEPLARYLRRVEAIAISTRLPIGSLLDGSSVLRVYAGPSSAEYRALYRLLEKLEA